MCHLHEKTKPIHAVKGTHLGCDTNPPGRQKMKYRGEQTTERMK